MSFSPEWPENISVRELIDWHATRSPEAVFLVDPDTGEQITFTMVQKRAASTTAMLVRHGVNPGERVAYATANNVQAVISILGIFYGGFVAVAINLVAGNDVITYVLEHSETKLVLANGKGMEIVEPIVGAADLSISIVNIDDVHGEFERSMIPPPLDPQSVALLMYTSGTTGRPKGVLLTHNNLLAGGGNTALAHHLSPGDRGLCVLPLYHINGLCVTVLGALLSGGALVVPPKFSVSTFWHNIIDNECSWFSIVPTQVSYLLHNTSHAPNKNQLGNVRFGRSASAPLSPDVQEAFEERFGISIIETMGLTETAAQILSNPLLPESRKIGSPGIAFGNEVMIADYAQNELVRGGEGEILVRGANVMQGYLKDASATSAAITEQRWLRTGDLGRMDEDGYVYVTGRLKELIIKGGENIAPREIDEALYSHSDVVEAAAFSKKCARYGETVAAAVTLAPGSTLTEAELIALCEKRIGKFKSPDNVYILPELPKGPSGKIQRIKIAELVGVSTNAG